MGHIRLELVFGYDFIICSFVFLWSLFELPSLGTGWGPVWVPLGRPIEKLSILDSRFSFFPLKWTGWFFKFVAIG